MYSTDESRKSEHDTISGMTCGLKLNHARGQLVPIGNARPARAERIKYRKAEDVATTLGATQLPNDPALKYLTCLNDAMEQETFKVGCYKPLIEHEEDCERKELDEDDEKTGKKKTKIVACCEACKCIFTKVADDEEEDEAE